MLEGKLTVTEDRLDQLEAQLKQAQMVAQEAETKYEEVRAWQAGSTPLTPTRLSRGRAVTPSVDFYQFTVLSHNMNLLHTAQVFNRT